MRSRSYSWKGRQEASKQNWKGVGGFNLEIRKTGGRRVNEEAGRQAGEYL